MLSALRLKVKLETEFYRSAKRTSRLKHGLCQEFNNGSSVIQSVACPLQATVWAVSINCVTYFYMLCSLGHCIKKLAFMAVPYKGKSSNSDQGNRSSQYS